ncbi:MAG: hypothetical protein WC284_12930 [Candidimonas sp.]
MNHKKAINVFSNNVILARWKHDIPGIGEKYGNSFSRNSRFTFQDNFVRLTVDKNKIKETNKIIPLDAEYVYGGGKIQDRIYNKKYQQYLYMEEFVINDIVDLNKKLISIEVFKPDFNTQLQYILDTIEEAEKYASYYNIMLNIETKLTNYIEKELEYRDLDD